MEHAAPFRTSTIRCPRCRSIELTNGDIRHCTRCTGSWVPEEVLHARISTMTSEVKPKIEWQVSTARLGLPCAVCTHAMEALLLFDVPVDRCHSHGVWFDKDELAEVLRRSAVEPAAVHDGSTALAVAEVAASGVEVGVVAIAVGVGVAILEGVLAALGAIFTTIDF